MHIIDLLKSAAAGADSQGGRRMQGTFLGQTPSSTVRSQQLSSAVAPDFVLAPWIVPSLRPTRRF
jgi:hypothetical protein